MKVRRCKYCNNIIDPDDQESLILVRKIDSGKIIGDIHIECAIENLPKGSYVGLNNYKKFYFEVNK